MSFPPVDTSTSANPASGKGFVLGPEEGDAYWWLGSTTLIKLDANAAGGNLDIVDHRVPAGYAPPPHVHHGQDEVFYIIDGEFTVRCGDDHWQAGPGSLVFLPRLVPHGFTVSDSGPGRTLLLNAPAGFADLISDLGQRTESLELPGPDVAMPDPGRIKSESEAHDIYAP